MESIQQIHRAPLELLHAHEGSNDMQDCRRWDRSMNSCDWEALSRNCPRLLTIHGIRLRMRVPRRCVKEFFFAKVPWLSLLPWLPELPDRLQQLSFCSSTQSMAVR